MRFARFARLAASVAGLTIAAGLYPAAADAAAKAATTTASSGDPLAPRQYGLTQVHAPQAWATTVGSGAVIAVVDAGVDLTHPDLKAKLLPGATFLECGTKSCGNGDWRSGPSSRRSSASIHGTHVAGIAAAATGNGIGIAGVAPAASILPVKVLDDQGGSFEDIAAGVRWSADHGANVINMSLGALPGVQALTLTGLISDVTKAVAYANNKGVVVVAAAGNESAPLCDTPGFDPGVVCVAATDKREARSFYSNFAVRPDLVAVSAPGGSALPLCGEDIVSTVPVGSKTTDPCRYGDGYDELAGTSMATPHVAGVAALLAAQGRSRANIIKALTTTARKPGTVARGVYDPAYGYGIVDAAAAVAAPAN